MPYNNYSKDNLKNCQLYFSSPSKFNDPYDCAIGWIKEELDENDVEIMINELNKQKDISELIDKSPEEQKEQIRNIMKIQPENLKKRNEEFIRNINKSVNGPFKNFGVCCFSEEIDNILMWSHYSNSHQGFCLEFETKYDLFNNKLFPVIYDQKIPVIKLQELLTKNSSCDNSKFVRTKSKYWEYEKEWRLIDKDKNGVFYKYEINSLSGIYFGCRMEKTKRKTICSIMKNHNANVNYYEMVPDKLEFKLNIRKIHNSL